jgi:glycosyltransferase involved in cell wall biosynthesis
LFRGKEHVSIVIPTFNEEIGIREVLLSIPYRELGEPEVLVVDGGSSDGTIQIAESLGAKVIISREKGYGKAVLEGLNYAKGDYIVVIDGDGVYDSREIPELLRIMESQNADVVSGSRYLGVTKPGSISSLHLIGDRLLAFFANVLLNTQYTDLYSGFRVVRKDFVWKIKDRITEPLQYSLILSTHECNGKIVEAPITFYPRLGKSKMSTVRDGFRILRLILSQSWRGSHEC